MIWALLLATDAPTAGAMPSSLDYARLVEEAMDGGRLIQAQAMLGQWRAAAQPDDRKAMEMAETRMALEKRRAADAMARFAPLEPGDGKSVVSGEGGGGRGV